jgi:SpoVK/Ycf46/Vps4 family AAA+-type ATPase
MAADLLDESVLCRLGALLSGYSGADIEQIVGRAAFEAYRRSRASQAEVPLTFDLIAHLISGWPKSVDNKMLQKYHDWGQSRHGSTEQPGKKHGADSN